MKKKFTPETLEHIVFLSSPVLSRDGRLAAWVASVGNMEDGLFRSKIHCADPADGKVLYETSDENGSEKQPFFSADGKFLYFLSDGSGEWQIWRKDLRDGKTEKVTSARHGIVRCQLSDDGRKIVFETTVFPGEEKSPDLFCEMNPDEKTAWKKEEENKPYYVTELTYKLDDWYGMRKGEVSAIGTVDLPLGHQKLLWFDGMEAVNPAISHDGRKIAFYGYPYHDAHGLEAELFLCDADGVGLKQMTKEKGVMADCPPVFTQKDRSVICPVYPPYEDGSCIELPLFVATDGGEQKLLFEEGEGIPRECYGLHPMCVGRSEYGEQGPYMKLSADEKWLYFQSGGYGRTGIFRLSLDSLDSANSTNSTNSTDSMNSTASEGSTDIADAAGKKAAVQTVLCLEGQDILSFSVDSLGNLLYLAGDVQQPAEIFYAACSESAETGLTHSEGAETGLTRSEDTGTGWPNARQLTNENAWLSEYEFGKTEEHWITGRDGKTKLQYFLVYPAGYDFSAKKAVPAVLDVKGGPQTMYVKSFWHEFQALAGEGMAVICGNPRGSVGFGKAFCSGAISWKNEAMEDLMDMVNDAVSLGVADPEKIGVTGGSYGGYMTLKLIGRTKMFAAAVTQRCLANPVTSYGTGDIGFVSASVVPEHFHMKDFLDDRAKGNIISYVDQMDVPLLILHGMKDYRCGFEQAEQVFAARKERHPDWPTRLVAFPGANHGVTRTGKLYHQVRHLKELTDWFAHYLKEQKKEEDGQAHHSLPSEDSPAAAKYEEDQHE